MVAMSARGAIASDGEERKGESVSIRWAVLGAVRWRGVCVCSVRRVSIEARRRLVLGPAMLRWSTISICLAKFLISIRAPSPAVAPKGSSRKWGFLKQYDPRLTEDIHFI